MIERLRSEAGESPVNLILIAPVLALILGLLIAAGRIAGTENAMTAAAASAAREATLADDPWQARAAAGAAAASVLNQRGVSCGGMSLNVDAAALNNAPGVEGNVRVSVNCSVPLADLAVPGVPGVKPMTGSSVSPVDTYRDR